MAKKTSPIDLLQTKIDDYVNSVVSGRLVSCQWVRLACERHLRDLARAEDDDYPYTFDIKRARKAVKFIENLPHVKGHWAARRLDIKLSDWQCWALCMVFGWVRKSDGMRRFREAYLAVPRKNGKSVLAAGVGLYCMVDDGEYGAEVYSGATTEKQAWEVFRPARIMAMRTPELQEYYGLSVHAKALLREEDFARFEPLIGKPGDGSSPSCAIVDEFHEHDTPDLYDTMMTGMGARQQPLMFIITTAGVNIAGPCYEKQLEVQQMLQGVMEAERLFGCIWTLDVEDDWRDAAVWQKANPNLGISVSPDYLEAQVAQAMRQPAKQSIVACKHFNRWTGARSMWLNLTQWQKAGDDTLRTDTFQRLPCYIGLDLATRIDIAASVRLYVRTADDGATHYYAFPTFYLPESVLMTSKNAEKYRSWATQGYLTLLEGEEIPLQHIEDELKAQAGEVTLREVAYDPWQATQLAQGLRDEQVQTVEFRLNTGNLSPAMREMEAALAAGRFHHNANPCLTWMASNVVAKANAKDELYPRKELPDNKIDGIIALLMALGRAMTLPEPQKAYQLIIAGGKRG